MKSGRLRRARSIQRLLTLVTPLILVCMVARHAYLVHRFDLTRWKGGGFGMFASVDRMEYRILRVKLHCAGSEVPALLRNGDGKIYDRLVWYARSLPHGGHIQELGHKLRHERWVIENGVATLLSEISRGEQKERASEALEPEAVELSVHRVRFDAPHSERSIHQLAHYEFR